MPLRLLNTSVFSHVFKIKPLFSLFEAPLPFMFMDGRFRHWRTGSSLRRRRNLNSVSNVCEAAPDILVLSTRRTQRITGSAFRISFHPDWQIYNGFLNRPIIAPTQILVLTGGVPEQGLRRRYFVDGLNQSFNVRLWRRLNWVEPPSPSPYDFLCLKKKNFNGRCFSVRRSYKREKTYCMLVFFFFIINITSLHRPEYRDTSGTFPRSHAR